MEVLIDWNKTAVTVIVATVVAVLWILFEAWCTRTPLAPPKLPRKKHGLPRPGESYPFPGKQHDPREELRIYEPPELSEDQRRDEVDEAFGHTDARKRSAMRAKYGVTAPEDEGKA